MTKCSKCSAEIEDGMKFCPECGERVPQTKGCPQCHTQWPVTAKFCAECGYNFSGSNCAGGSLMGDKNVVAGDVNVNNSTTTTNNTTTNTTNNTSNVTNTNTYINQDESKRIVRCGVCERPIVITEALACKECHQYVCREHYNAVTSLCTSCAAKKTSDAEASYRKELEIVLEDGIIDKNEFDQLEVLRKQLGISAPRAMELQKIMKAERTAKNLSARGDDSLMTVEKAQCERAKELLFDQGKGRESVKLLESIYRQHPLNEEVLSTYLAALFTYDEDRAMSIIMALPVDMVRAHLVLFDIALKSGDMAAAEIKLTAAEALWPDDMLLKCRHAELMYETAIQLESRTYLAEAMDWLTSLDKPKDKLEASWQFYVQCLISQALGDAVPPITASFCKEKNLYYFLVTGQFSGIRVINEEELCTRCMRNRDFTAGVIPSLTKEEFQVLKCAAERGEPRAALVLGDCYYDLDGNGVVISNLEEAFHWYEKSANGGLADGQFMLGTCFESGMGCSIDDDVALELYKKAAEQGLEVAVEKIKDFCSEKDLLEDEGGEEDDEGEEKDNVEGDEEEEDVDDGTEEREDEETVTDESDEKNVCDGQDDAGRSQCPMEPISEVIKKFAAKDHCVVLQNESEFSRLWKDLVSRTARSGGDQFDGKQFDESNAIALITSRFSMGHFGAIIERRGICVINRPLSAKWNGCLEWNDLMTKDDIRKIGFSDVVQICSAPKVGLDVDGLTNPKFAVDLFNAIYDVTN